LQEETCQDVLVTCVDNDSVALEEGQYVAEQAGVESQITYVYGNAFQLVDASNNALLEEVPDVVVVSGLYESIADDAVVCQSLLQIHTLLRPNGHLLVTTQPSHPRQEIVANVLSDQRGEPWVIATRPLPRMKRWMREAGFHTLTSDEEPEGLCGLVWGLA
jgi:2-polyprenyl-3-methyl-5-hydroxy-6-metoxy-1,4-benzoquinol methylase